MMRLLSYLTKRNLQYLSVIFRIILDSAEPTYGYLWRRFEQILPEGTAVDARAKLGELKKILDEHRSKK